MAHDGLDISSGGVVAVDSEQLRGVHDQLTRVREQMSDVPARLQNVAGLALDAEQPFDEMTLIPRTQQLVDDIAVTCANLMTMVHTFEIVEARLTDSPIIEPQELPWWDVLGRSRWFREPTLSERVDDVIAEWQADRHAHFVNKAELMGLHYGWLFPGGLMGAAMWRQVARLYPKVVEQTGLGVVGAQTPLRPKDHTVVIEPAVVSHPRRPVQGFRDLLDRMPEGSSQVVIEEYTEPGREPTHVVYIAGTRPDPDQPWDMGSNVDLYVNRQESASYDAVVAAMRDAGIESGDPVVLVTHSQGGMIGTHIAASGDFTVIAHNSYGSPLQGEPLPGVAEVAVRHKDDPVGLLAGGGSGMVSNGVVLVERVARPELHVDDLWLASHHLDAYRDTAQMMDESPDGSLGRMRSILDRLGEATAITSREYTVKDEPAR